ncbi:MAG: glycoside hydrolase family 3 C-terminal domain-containing protein, partial [Microbacterium sp.]|nr:glycoside hydrolase family 3 C-terminal domain-containing protein [Microbacterium sp.]
LGLLDETFDAPPTQIDLDTPAHRDAARRLAEESVVLLTNSGVLPLDVARTRRVAVIGPNADAAAALMGCYSFANHVLAHHPGVPYGFEIPAVLDALRDELPDASLTFERGVDVEGDDASGIEAAVASARNADVAIVVVGDRAGLFGRGTVGEGNDVDDLELPGLQRRLVEAVVATGTPVVTVVISGRPYALGWAVDEVSAPAALVQAFFPGEEGGSAIAGILSGRVTPSGRLPVSLPRSVGAQPYSYLHTLLAGPTEITSADPTPPLAFGHGLTYTSFERTGLSADAEVVAGGTFAASVRVRNTGTRTATDVVQLYAHDTYASVNRPVAQLMGYARVTLAPGEEVAVRFDVPTSRLAFTGQDGRRIVEPGDIELWVGPSCADRETETSLRIGGPVHALRAEAL